MNHVARMVIPHHGFARTRVGALTIATKRLAAMTKVDPAACVFQALRLGSVWVVNVFDRPKKRPRAH